MLYPMLRGLIPVFLILHVHSAPAVQPLGAGEDRPTSTSVPSPLAGALAQVPATAEALELVDRINRLVSTYDAFPDVQSDARIRHRVPMAVTRRDLRMIDQAPPANTELDRSEEPGLDQVFEGTIKESVSLGATMFESRTVEEVDVRNPAYAHVVYNEVTVGGVRSSYSLVGSPGRTLHTVPSVVSIPALAIHVNDTMSGPIHSLRSCLVSARRAALADHMAGIDLGSATVQKTETAPGVFRFEITLVNVKDSRAEYTALDFDDNQGGSLVRLYWSIGAGVEALHRNSGTVDISYTAVPHDGNQLWVPSRIANQHREPWTNGEPANATEGSIIVSMDLLKIFSNIRIAKEKFTPANFQPEWTQKRPERKIFKVEGGAVVGAPRVIAIPNSNPAGS